MLSREYWHVCWAWRIRLFLLLISHTLFAYTIDRDYLYFINAVLEFGYVYSI